jgi:hypothetical protein
MEDSLLKNCRDVKKLNLLSSKRLCRNTRNHLDVMLSASEASVFPTPYEKQILRLRLRMTLRYRLQAEGFTKSIGSRLSQFRHLIAIQARGIFSITEFVEEAT